MDARVTVQLRNGYHVNSNTPADDYLIPLRLTWAAAPFEVAATVYPKPKMEKYSFSSKPLSVFTDDFDILTRLKVPASVIPGPGVLVGKLRYQACNDNSCLPPKTIEVRLPYQIQWPSAPRELRSTELDLENFGGGKFSRRQPEREISASRSPCNLDHPGDDQGTRPLSPSHAP